MVSGREGKVEICGSSPTEQNTEGKEAAVAGLDSALCPPRFGSLAFGVV